MNALAADQPLIATKPNNVAGSNTGNGNSSLGEKAGYEATNRQAPPHVRPSFAQNEVKFCDISDLDEEDDDDEDDDDRIGYDDEFGDNAMRHEDTISISTALTRRSSSRQQQKQPSDEDVDSIMSVAKPRPKPEIPDGGYGWVVVFASLVVSLIADGISFSFGLLYTEFLVYFGASKSKTAWIGSIFLAVPLLSGPVMSNLVDTYGCQRMTIIGGVLSCIGFVLASMANSVEQLYWTFGVIGGLGLGIGYVTAVCSVVGWFDKRRTFATGIGASGTGIGTFLYAPLTQYLIESYGWRGTCLILAGTLFNISVCGCLMLDPEWLTESNKLESRSQSMKTFSNSSVCLDEIKKLIEDGAPSNMVLDTLMTNYNTEVNQQLTDSKQSSNIKKYRSLLLLPTYLSPDSELDCAIVTGNQLGSRRSLRKKQNGEVYLFDECQQHQSSNKKVASSTLKSDGPTFHSNDSICGSEKCTVYDEGEQICSRIMCHEDLDKYGSQERMTNNVSFAQHVIGRKHSLDDDENGLVLMVPERPHSMQTNRNNNGEVLLSSGNHLTVAKPMMPNGKQRTDPVTNKGVLRHSIKNSNYLRNMRIHRNSIHYRGAMLSTHRYRLRTSSCPNIYRNSMTTLAQDSETSWKDSVMEVLKSMFDMSLFLNPKFASFQISTLLLFVWFIVPYFYLPEHMLTKEYVEADSAFVISVIGVSQTIGMIGLGYIGDKPWLNVPKTYACCLVVCGISVVIMPMVVHNYLLLCLVGALFGLMFASSFSFTPIILVQLVSLDDFTCAYGLVLLIQGVGNLVGPPISGLLYEMFGMWDYAFYTSGFFISLAGVFVYITGLLQDRDARLAADKEDDCEIC